MINPGAVLITGANRGLGLGLARQFLTRGWRVFAGCRAPASGTELDGLATAYPACLTPLALDVRDPVSVAALGTLLAAETLDVLVNNAGINPVPRGVTVDQVTVGAVADALEVNLLGSLRILQVALPALRRSSHPRVINISSGAGSLSHNSSKLPQPAYCISKAALNMLTHCSARDLPGITVVSISPGWIRTDMGGADAELGLEEASGPLATTIAGLSAEKNGRWLDRFGNPSGYEW